MSDRIDKLTKKQAQELPAIRDEWLGHGLSTEPADRAGAVEGVNDAYRAAGLEPPPLVIWLRSPLEGVIGAEFVRQLLKGSGKEKKVRGQVRNQIGGQVWGQIGGQVWGQIGDQVRGQVWGQIGDQVRGQVWGQIGGQVWGQVGGQVGDQVRGQVRDQIGVWDQVRDQIGDQIRGQVWDQVGDQVWGQIGDQVRGQVWGQIGGQVWGQVGGQVGDQVRGQVWGQIGGQVWGQVGGQVGGQIGDQVRDQIGGQVWDQVRDQIGQVRDHLNAAVWGQHEAGWVSWIDTFRRFGLKCCDRAGGLIKVAQCAGWWWPMRGVVILTERPAELHRDEEGRLHADSGPAVRYPDGWSIWAIHGVRVTQHIVERPETLTVEQIRDEPNVEVRRVMLERFGAERFMTQAGGKMVAQDDWGKLWRLPDAPDEPQGKPMVLIEMVNSTPEPDDTFHTYFERVPPHLKTPLAALAWQAGMTKDQYAQMGPQT
jgi:hypothetical protein